jgi:hypothetical protein
MKTRLKQKGFKAFSDSARAFPRRSYSAVDWPPRFHHANSKARLDWALRLPAIGVFFEFFLGFRFALRLYGSTNALVCPDIIFGPAGFFGLIDFVLAGLDFDCFVSRMGHAALLVGRR